MMAIPRFLRSLCVVLLLASLTPLAGAQIPASASSTSASRSSAATQTEETLVLSPFSVSAEKDNGYLAADTLSAGRLATNVLKTPADITVLTRDFLDDIGAFTMLEAATWLTSADVTEPTERDFGNNVSFRGTAPAPSFRNYFNNGMTPEEYSVERLEGARGPNSILYGDALIGGILNITTKRAQFGKDAQSLRLRTDTFGSVYASIDVNQVVNRELAFRVNAFGQKGRSWMDNFWDDRVGAHLTATWKPWRGAEFVAEYEQGYNDRANYRPYSYRDQISRWDGVTALNGPVTAAPANSGISRLGVTWVSIPSLGAPMNWANFGLSTGNQLPIVDDADARAGIARFPTLSRREFNVQPAEIRLGTRHKHVLWSYNQTLPSKLTTEVAFSYNDSIKDGNPFLYETVNIDVNRVLPDGRPNPNFGERFSRGTLRQQKAADYYTGFRIGAAYPIVTRSFSQVISAVAQHREHIFDVAQDTYTRVNGVADVTAAANQVVSWRYWNTDRSHEPLPQNDANNTFRFIPSRDSHNKDKLQSVQLNTVGKYFRGSLDVVAGVRFDDYDAHTRDFGTRDPATGATLTHLRTSTPKGTNALTKSGGAVWFPFEKFGFYANYSEGFKPSILNFPNLAGNAPVNILRTDNYNLGLRFTFLENKLVGSVGYYRSNEQDRPQVQRLTNINAIWDNIPGSESNRVLGGAYSSYIDFIDTRIDGWETDITANLTRGLRLKFNASISDGETVSGIPGANAYYEKHLPTWRAALVNPAITQARRNTIQTNLTAFENDLVTFGTNGRRMNGMIDYRVNAFLNYQFTTGPLKNLRIGGGANFYGEKLLGSPTANPFDYINAKAYYLTSAVIGYRFKLGRVPCDVQVNITNLLDYDEPIYSSVSLIDGRFYYEDYSYPMPRSARVTATLRF